MIDLKEGDAIDYISFLRYGIAQEINANCKYKYKKVAIESFGNKPDSRIYISCSHPNCKAKVTFLKDHDIYIFISGSFTHFHNDEPKHEIYHTISPFLQKFLHRYFDYGGKVSVALLTAYKELGIPESNSFSFFSYSQKNLDKFAKTINSKFIGFQMLGYNQYSSAQNYAQKFANEKPDDLIYFDIDNCANPQKIIFIYASAEINALLPQLTYYHIDATFKLIYGNLAYYVVSIKLPTTHTVPILHFVIKKDSADIISFCLSKYFTWCSRNPSIFIADCARQILNGILQSFPDASVFWCSLHVIRAIHKNREKFQTEEEFTKIVKKVSILCYTKQLTPEDAQKILTRINELLANDATALKYMKDQWLNFTHQWVITEKPEGTPLTNNVSESGFRKIKYYDFGGQLHISFDEFIYKLITLVSPSYVIRLSSDLNLNHQIVNVPIKVPKKKEENRITQIDDIKLILDQIHGLLYSEANVSVLLNCLKPVVPVVKKITDIEKFMSLDMLKWNLSPDINVMIMKEISDYMTAAPGEIIKNWKTKLDSMRRKYGIPVAWEE